MFQLLVVLFSVSSLVYTSRVLPAELQLLSEVGQSRPLYEDSTQVPALVQNQVSVNSVETTDIDILHLQNQQPNNEPNIKSGAEETNQAKASATGLLKVLNPNKQRHVLPAEKLPLPIIISTRPGLRTVIAPETITLREHGIAKIGDVVQRIPTAVSHQVQTVVHKHANILTPIVAPVVRTYSTQILRAYHTPLLLQPMTLVSKD